VLLLFLKIGIFKSINKDITHAPPLIPPKRGEEDKRHTAVPAVHSKTHFFYNKIPGEYRIGLTAWDFRRDFRDLKKTLYNYIGNYFFWYYYPYSGSQPV